MSANHGIRLKRSRIAVPIKKEPIGPADFPNRLRILEPTKYVTTVFPYKPMAMPANPSIQSRGIPIIIRHIAKASKTKQKKPTQLNPPTIKCSTGFATNRLAERVTDFSRSSRISKQGKELKMSGSVKNSMLSQLDIFREQWCRSERIWFKP